MAYDNDTPSSAELEREVEAQRNRVEERIGEIQARLSPGQLIDEVLSYTKSGGSHIASNLGNQIAQNPLPAALLGVSLAWLMMGNKQGGGSGHDYHETSGETYYPYARVSGAGLQRTSHSQDEYGEWQSEFIDDAGKTYRAKSDMHGKRKGHFVDDAGKIFSGFIDDAGNRVSHFRDEAGNMLGDAGTWASHTWHDIKDAVGRTADGVARRASNLMGQASEMSGSMGGSARHGADKAGRMLQDALYQQPLVAGALAFAAGAALGAALPHTEQEDKLLGEAADKVKREAGHVAGDLYEEGKQKAGEIYEKVADRAGVVYEQAKSTITSDNGTARQH
jgi:hypothetical protein